jgi:thymidylate kinase
LILPFFLCVQDFESDSTSETFMPFIAFLGCDGSGKSAVIQSLSHHLKAAGHPVTLGHWRPKAIDSSRAGSSGADDPHGQAPRGMIGSVLKLGWLWINWWGGWLTHLGRASRGGFVIFDRYHGDLIVDPRRYRYGGPMWLARLASRWMPQPDRVIFLDADSDVLLSRKQEVSAAALESARAKYLALCGAGSCFRVVDASGSLDQVVDLVSREIES